MNIKKLKTVNFAYCIILFVLFNSGCKTDKKESVVNLPDPSIYAEHVRTTDFQTPEEELKSFILPEGFKITLFASEPDISKPINMEFDHKGRLWVTQSSEYPIAAGKGEGADKITILEDTDGDGKADKIDDFVKDLNIPIGILPMQDGVIAYSIPNIYYFKDKNGDNIADGDPKILLGPFGHKDTHGMVSNFTRGFDGWIYSCHGFTNTSTVSGIDRDSVSMTSGNTFRFRKDGSRVEQTTYGRVNPFGLAFDEWGYLYSTDCHSRPIYQLIPQGRYPHFGNQSPAIGFAPEMMGYDLGSTAIAGLTLYSGDQFPKEYRNSFYTGDVVTCRIDRNTRTFEGSTPVAHKKDPFLISRDPWFRPVDVKMGPDGALYLADFYNRIIGHYEVPLGHKGRDRKSGRIWKITYEGDGKNKRPSSSEKTLDFYIGQLSDSSLQTRMDATNTIVDKWGGEAKKSIQDLVNTENVDDYSLIQGLWILSRLGALESATIQRAFEHRNPMVRVHMVRIVKENRELFTRYHDYLLANLSDENPHVRRVCAEVLGEFASKSNVDPLFDLYRNTEDSDSYLKYTALLSIQQNLKHSDVLAEVVSSSPAEDKFKVIYTALLDLPSKEGANYMLKNFNKYNLGVKEEMKIAKYLTRSIDNQNFDAFVHNMKGKYASETEQQFEMITALEDGITQRGGKVSRVFNEWKIEYAKSILRDLSKNLDMKASNIPKEWTWALSKAGEFKLMSYEQELHKIFADYQAPTGLRISAAKSLLKIDPKNNLNTLISKYRSPQTTEDFKIALSPVLGSRIEDNKVVSALSSNLRIHNQGLQTAIVRSLMQSSKGRNEVLNALEKEELRIDLLYNIEMVYLTREKFTEAEKNRFETLKERLGGKVEDINEIIETRIAQFELNENQIGEGKNVFAQNCAICHQIGGEGQIIGPQLDGIANWGKEALAVKILDPNRNISESFRTYKITMKNGETLTGLFRREEGEAIVFANVTGEEFKINKNEIDEQLATGTTLMPSQFRNTIKKEDFNKLLNYLSSVK